MANKPRIKPELLNELLECQDPSQIFEADGLLDELKRAPPSESSIPRISSRLPCVALPTSTAKNLSPVAVFSCKPSATPPIGSICLRFS